MQNPHTIQHGNFALYNHLLKMEKSICNFHQRNTSNIRSTWNCPNHSPAPAYDAWSGIFSVPYATVFPSIFRYRSNIFFWPVSALLTTHLSLIKMSYLSCTGLTAPLNPISKTYRRSHTAAIPPHYIAARKNKRQACETFFTVFYILWTTFLHHHTVFNVKKLALLCVFRIPFCIIRNKWFL